VIALVDAGCGSDELDGEVVISGSSTAQPVVSRVAGEFAAEHPLTFTHLDSPGTGEGFLLFCDGLIDINDASRAIQPEERKLCERNDVHFAELEIARDAVVLVTAKKTPKPTCLDLPELYALMGPEADGLRDWAGANAVARALGGAGDLPHQRLSVVSPGSASGTQDVLVELAIAAAAERRKQLPELRRDAVIVASDQLVADEVRRLPGAVGVLGFTVASSSLGRLRTIAIDGGEGCVSPTRKEIAAGRYPLARSLYVYVNLERADSNPTVAAFVDLLVSREELAEANKAGAVSLPPLAAEATQARWAEAH
jgi:phosphate transport system substrate-binding protein